MTDATTLAADLDAVATHLPLIATGLRTSTLAPATQHTVGALLIELGENLHHHADTETTPTTRRVPLEPPTANDCEPP